VNRRGLGAWLLLAGACVAIDGAVGGAVAVLVAAVVLAGLPRRLLAIVGVVALAAVPVAVVGRGLPADDEVSPAFVVGSLVPHHLMFAGLVLVGTWAVLDLVARRRAGEPAVAVPPPPDRLPVAVGLAIVGIVAIGAIAASVAVLAA
jgi:hypothetical protein